MGRRVRFRPVLALIGAALLTSVTKLVHVSSDLRWFVPPDPAPPSAADDGCAETGADEASWNQTGRQRQQLELVRSYRPKAYYDSPAPSTSIATPPLLPEGCEEVEDDAVGWPIVKIAMCGEAYLFGFEEQLTRPWPPPPPAKTNGTASSVVDATTSSPLQHCHHRGAIVVRCEVWDFNHPAHFIVGFLPCWSAWMEYAREYNQTNVRLVLVGAEDIREDKGWASSGRRSEVSAFARAWVEMFGCEADVDESGSVRGGDWTSAKQQHVIDVKHAPLGNGFHFDLPRDPGGDHPAGMMAYFHRPYHAHWLRAMAMMGKGNSGGGNAGSEHTTMSETTAAPTFRVLFINRNNGKRAIGGEGIANITSAIREKLLQMGIASSAVRTNQIYDFGMLDAVGQMKMMHEHDLIISPHGNQLSSIGFAPECAAVLEVYPRYHAMPGYYLPWAVNGGVRAFGLYGGTRISETRTFLQKGFTADRYQARDVPFVNKTKEIVLVVPFLARARRECCQALLDHGEWSRAMDARCV